MYNRLLKLPTEQNTSIFLFGPRGTGKTHWVRERLPNAIYLDLLEFELYKSLAVNPGRLIDYIPQAYSGWIIIDEVQKIRHASRVSRRDRANTYQNSVAAAS